MFFVLQVSGGIVEVALLSAYEPLSIIHCQDAPVPGRTPEYTPDIALNISTTNHSAKRKSPRLLYTEQLTTMSSMHTPS